MEFDTCGACQHEHADCVNHYEFIRKYRCNACGETMMCACDRDFALRFLPHQVDRGRDHDSGLEVPVTIGFQPQICRECRGLAPEAHPTGELYGRSSKVLRYYWREIYFETTKRFARWVEENGFADATTAREQHPTKHDEIEREVVQEFKVLHARSPKYTYSEVSSAEVLARFNVEILDLRAQYDAVAAGERRLITADGAFATPEKAVTEHFRHQGFDVMECESRPFHVLFGIYLWLLVQDPGDDVRHLVGFGDRFRYEAGEPSEMVWTFLPKDFGSRGYATRRAAAIDEHFAFLGDDLEWLFEYWRGPSADLRQYLWAHREEDVARARRVLEILPHDRILQILRYPVGSYWKRFTGWPDLLVHNSTSYFFVEVKGSGDKLREDQKRWIQNNAEILNLPFKLAKVHRQSNVLR